MIHSERRTAGALDVLERQDVILRSLLDGIEYLRDGGVESRWDFGNRAKEAIRHLGDREAAVVDVARVIAHVPGLEATSSRMLLADAAMRDLYDDVGHMSRGIPLMDLNVAQDFDGAFLALVEMVRTEIDWELDHELEHIAWALGSRDLGQLHSARWIAHHAPTTLARKGSRWYERTPVISWMLTAWDHMRDYPRAARSARRS